MLPKTMARVGQAAWQAVTTSSPRDGAAPVDLGDDPRVVDPLDAVRALLHHPARAHGHVRVPLELQAGRVVVGILEEVEPADLVRAVVRAVASAHAAVIRHLVEALVAVRRRFHGADGFAGGLLAVHAEDGLEVGIRARRLVALVIAIDPQPVHLARAEDLLPAHDRDVVLGLAGDHAGAAADAAVEIDGHAPGVDGLPAPGLFGIQAQTLRMRSWSGSWAKSGVLSVFLDGPYPDELAALHHVVVLDGRQGRSLARLDDLEPRAVPGGTLRCAGRKRWRRRRSRPGRPSSGHRPRDDGDRLVGLARHDPGGDAQASGPRYRSSRTSPSTIPICLARAGLMSATLSQVNRVRGLGSSCSQPLLAKRPSQIVGSGRKTNSRPPSSVRLSSACEGSGVPAILNVAGFAAAAVPGE